MIAPVAVVATTVSKDSFLEVYCTGSSSVLKHIYDIDSSLPRFHELGKRAALAGEKYLLSEYTIIRTEGSSNGLTQNITSIADLHLPMIAVNQLGRKWSACYDTLNKKNFV